MSSTPFATPSRETVAEAAAWIARLHSSQRSPEVEAALRSWLHADPQNARAFEGMTEIWEVMPAVPAGELPRVQVWSRPRWSAPFAKAAVVLMTCGAVAVAVYGLWRAPTYTTAVTEQRIVNLDDGTRVSLNSGTRMVVDYTDAERRIVLKQGEAFFEVAHRPHQPFVVIAGEHRVTALGTAFAVRYEPQRTAVTLVDGKVMADTVTLVPGQRLTFDNSAPAPKLDTPRVEVVTAWRRGEIILDETALSDAIAEMNRYDKIPLVVDDPAVAGLPVSGIYRTGDSPGFANIVARMYGLSVAQEQGKLHLKRAAASAP